MPIPRNRTQYEFNTEFTYDQAQLATVDLTAKVFDIPAGKRFRVDKVTYDNPTGLAAGAAFFVISLKDGSTTMASWSTQTGAEGTIAADTPVSLTLSATDINRIAAGGDVLSLAFIHSGTVTLPPGRVIVHGRYV